MRQEEISPHNLVEQVKQDTFDESIRELLGDLVSVPPEPLQESFNLDPISDFDLVMKDKLCANNVIPLAETVD